MAATIDTAPGESRTANALLVEFGEIPIKRQPNTSVPAADIHSLKPHVRLIVPGPNGRFVQESPHLSDEQLLNETLKKLVNWLKTGESRKLNSDPLYPLSVVSRRKKEESQNQVAEAKIRYQDTVLDVLRSEFTNQEQRTQILEEWLTFYPELKDIHQKSKPISVQKLQTIPSLQDPKYANVLESIVKLFKTSAAEITKSDGAKSTKKTADGKKELMQNPDVMRLFSRLCRISSNLDSEPIQSTIRSNMDFLKNTNKELDARDIEDSLVAVAENVCTEKKPKCQDCPLKSICNAYKQFISDALFMKFFMRQPLKLGSGLSKVCKDGKECLLCSPDPLDHVSTSSIGVEAYPKISPPRKHFAVCLMERISPVRELFFLKSSEGLAAETCVLRGPLPLNSPSSEESISTLQSYLNLGENAHVVSLSRCKGLDYVTRQSDSLDVHYIFIARVPPEFVASFPGTWRNPVDVFPGLLATDEYVLMQNYCFFRKTELANGRDGLEGDGEMDDAERLSVLWEGMVKRMGMLPYPVPV